MQKTVLRTKGETPRRESEEKDEREHTKMTNKTKKENGKRWVEGRRGGLAD